MFHVRSLYTRTLAPWEAPQQSRGTRVPVVLCSLSCDLEQVTSPARLGLFTYKGKDCESMMPRCHMYWSQEIEITQNLWLQTGQGLETAASSSASLQPASLLPPWLSPPPEPLQPLPLVQFRPHPNASLQQSESLLKLNLTTSVHFF